MPSVHSPDPSMSTTMTRNSLANITNAVHPPPTKVPVNCTSVDDYSSVWPRPYHTIHVDRVARVDCHDTDAWAQEKQAHCTKPGAAAASSSPGLNSTIASDDSTPVDVAGSHSPLMNFRTSEPRRVEQFSSTALLHEDSAIHSHEWTPLVASGSSLPPALSDVTTGLCSEEDLSEGQRRVGEILVRCGVIEPTERQGDEPAAAGCPVTFAALPVDPPLASTVADKWHSRRHDKILIRALANWTSQWLHTLVIHPYLQGSFRFQYHGKSSSSVAWRIRRVLAQVNNPIQVAAHALWLIGNLGGNIAHGNTSFLSVPIFQYLHNNGTIFAEDFMFHTFVACAMIGDKTVNDATLSTNTWNRLTRIPQVVLNATEKCALSCLKWNVTMTRTQWQDTIVYFRSCIKAGSTFDPFASHEESSASGVMACYFDELIGLTHPDGLRRRQQEKPTLEIVAPRPVRHATHWGVFDAMEWRPQDDPVVNQKPRTIGIAPGADRSVGTFNVGTTAKDLLDSILGCNNAPDLRQFGRPVGTSFCGSFGAIGARLAHTVKMARACQLNIHSHGYLTT